MPTLLLKNAHVLVTMDQNRREIPDGCVYVRDGVIEKIGMAEEMPASVDEIIDLRGHVVMPGLVNTHHHFYQTLTRAVPGAQNANLFQWLTTLYPIWARLRPEDIRISTQTALAELALSGCTTASDHLYLFPNGSALDDEIEAAKAIGLRLHASRGSMSLGQSQGGLPPDSVVDQEERILEDSIRLIERYHDPRPGSKLQIVLAPCSPFSVTGSLMKQSALLAREYGVHLHTHLAETQDEEAFCVEKFGYRPLAYMQSLDWVGEDVWFAHSVWITDEEIGVYARTGCGVAHCPSSNMRLASGIAPIMKYMKAGVKVGIGVDGSASNDGSHLLSEARQSMLLSRLAAGIGGASFSDQTSPGLMTARQALELATIGGAKVLGRTDIGSLEPGKCADIIAINIDRLEFAGAQIDAVAAILFCQAVNVDYTIVGGEVIVCKGELHHFDMERHIAAHNEAAHRLLAEGGLA